MSLHPSVAAVRGAVRRELGALEPGQVVLVACSGGPDSLALLAATVSEARRPGLRVVGATVDHGLQEDSAGVTARVVAQMAALGVDETASARVTVDAGGRGPEAAAREARYAVLGQLAEHFGAHLVLLGHTLDDQAETVLLGLARGSGARSLSGMRRGFDRYRRPLLSVRRDVTVTACQVEGIEFWEDPHNVDPGYARVRVRDRVLPVLEAELGPGVADALARTAEQLRDDADLLDDLADAAYAEDVDPADEQADEQAGGQVGVRIAALAARPAAVRTRVLRRAALAAGSPASELSRGHVVALAALLEPEGRSRTVQLPGHLSAVVAGDRIGFGPTAVEG